MLRAKLSARGAQRELANAVGATEGAISRLANNPQIGASELVEPISKYFGWRLPDAPLPPRVQAIADVAAALHDDDMDAFAKLETYVAKLSRARA